MQRVTLRYVAPGLLSAALLLSACAIQSSPEGAEPIVAATSGTVASSATSSAPAPAPTEMRLSDGTVIANAKVVPQHVINLGFELDGMVSELNVKPGDTVSVGQVLGSLDTRRLVLEVEQARAELAEARANYERLTDGVSDSELAQGRAQVDEARARLAVQEATVTKQDLDAARAQLREARANEAQLRTGPRAVDVAALQAAVDQARARLQTREDGLAADKLRIELQVERAANELRDAQDAYSRIYWANQNGSNDGSELSQGEIDAEATAKRAVENAEKRRDELLLTLEEARKAEVTERDTYQADLREAEARLDRVFAPVLPDQIAAAEKQVARAQADLAKLEGAVRNANLDVSSAELRQAEAALASLMADPRTSDLAVAEARVTRAEVQLKQVELDVERGQVRSPIAGTVAGVLIEPGQVAKSGNTAIVVADLSAWQLTTADLNELSVSQIREDDPVRITFFALPGLELVGKVAYIETMGRESGIGTSYTVTVIPDTWDKRLRWNMSAQVMFSATMP